jgi:tripartite-type tricarboxylate transporter receptor subunit TctC
MNHLNQLSRAWALGLTLCLAGTSMAQTSTFPSKALKIVVPNAAGGAADITARTVAQKLAESLGQPVVTENKPSAGGIVAGEQVARSDPDGHTLLLISSGTAVSASLFKTLPFDTVKDFIPVSKLATFDFFTFLESQFSACNLRKFQRNIPFCSCVA